ncbi:MAG: hypothetical protein ABH851_08320 [Methanobacteriota archaeon]
MIVGAGLINIRNKGDGEVVIPDTMYHLILSKAYDELEITMW